MDLMQLLRMKNIFGPKQPIGNDLPSQGGIMGNMGGPDIFAELFKPKGDPYGNIMFGANNPAPPMQASTLPDTGFNAEARLKQLFTPQTEATDKYNELLTRMPTREQYKPGIARNIGGGLMSLAGSFGPRGNVIYNPISQRQGMEYRDEPFTKATEDWTRQIGPAKDAATMERYANANERQLASTALTQERIAQNDRAKAKIAEDKLELQRLKQDQPDWEFNYSGPKVIMSNSKTGQSITTNIDTGSLSESDKLAKQHTNKMEQIVKGAEEARKTGDEKVPTPFNIPDPNDPTKQIAVQFNPATNQWEQIKIGGQNIGPIMRPSGAAGALKQPAPDKLQIIRNKAQETMDAIKLIYDPEKKKLSPDILPNVGGSRLTFRQHLPGPFGTVAGETKINNIKARMIVELISEMKAQSQTGATGFGQLNLKELGVLESAASRLDPNMEEGEFAIALQEVYDKLQKVMQPEDGGSATKVPVGGKAKTADDYLKEAGL